MMNDDTRKTLHTRLRRIAGQVGGIQKMVADDRYCIDVLMQIAAARAALTKVGEIMLRSHVETCVLHALEDGDDEERRRKMDELLDVFSRYGRA